MLFFRALYHDIKANTFAGMFSLSGGYLEGGKFLQLSLSRQHWSNFVDEKFDSQKILSYVENTRQIQQ